MTLDPDLTRYPFMDWPQFSWFKRQNIPIPILVELTGLRVVPGRVASDGLFDPDDEGQGFLAFEQEDDCVFWCPATGALATWHGQAFALGEDSIANAATYAFDNFLSIHPDPLEWLRDQCRGIVVLNWNLAFDMLRDAPRVAISEDLLPTYRQNMRPRHLPELAVLTSNRRLAA